MYPSPVGIDHTDEWLRTIARYTGKEAEAEALIKEEREKWLPQMEKIQEEFARVRPDGERVEILGSLGQGRLVTQVPYFEEIGVKTPATICQDFDNLMLDEIEQIVDQSGDFDVLVNTSARSLPTSPQVRSGHRAHLPVPGKRLQAAQGDDPHPCPAGRRPELERPGRIQGGHRLRQLPPPGYEEQGVPEDHARQDPRYLPGLVVRPARSASFRQEGGVTDGNRVSIAK